DLARKLLVIRNLRFDDLADLHVGRRRLGCLVAAALTAGQGHQAGDGQRQDASTSGQPAMRLRLAHSLSSATGSYRPALLHSRSWLDQEKAQKYFGGPIVSVLTIYY